MTAAEIVRDFATRGEEGEALAYTARFGVYPGFTASYITELVLELGLFAREDSGYVRTELGRAVCLLL